MKKKNLRKMRKASAVELGDILVSRVAHFLVTDITPVAEMLHIKTLRLDIQKTLTLVWHKDFSFWASYTLLRDLDD